MAHFNRFRSKNSFTTLEIFDESLEVVVTRFVVYELFERERFQGRSRDDWLLYLFDRYAHLLTEVISTHLREKELKKWLEEWPGVGEITEIVEPLAPKKRYVDFFAFSHLK